MCTHNVIVYFPQYCVHTQIDIHIHVCSDHTVVIVSVCVSIHH